jgi:hypothetical protein
MRKYWRELLKIVRSKFKTYCLSVLKMNGADLDRLKKRY